MKLPHHACLGLVLCLPALAWAQQSTEPQDPLLMHRSPINPDNEGKIAVEGRIDLLVTDAAGKPVTDLQAGDFTMLDNVKFAQYHLFCGEASILTGDETPPELK